MHQLTNVPSVLAQKPPEHPLVKPGVLRASVGSQRHHSGAQCTQGRGRWLEFLQMSLHSQIRALPTLGFHCALGDSSTQLKWPLQCGEKCKVTP